MSKQIIEVPVPSQALADTPLSLVTQAGGVHLPTRTFVPVPSWPAQFDLEIDDVAHVGDSDDGARP